MQYWEQKKQKENKEHKRKRERSKDREQASIGTYKIGFSEECFIL